MEHAAGSVGDATIRLLARSGGIVLVSKPAGLPSEAAPGASRSVVSELALLLGEGPVHAASRLDVGVSGVMVCTLGRAASRRLEALRREGAVVRSYLGIASRAPVPEAGAWELPLGARRSHAGRARASTQGRDVRPARTRYRVLRRLDVGALVAFEPVTGRMHQIRAHAALTGAPLFGDARYGGLRRSVDARGAVVALGRIALHAWRVALPELEATAPVPEELRALWRRLGGSDADWP
jgi:23S rRNA-/tRNA-specific pseudouridylate synthase